MNGFTKIYATDPTGISGIIWGSEGRGKTHFALTFPGPIYHFNFDKPIDDVLWAARNGMKGKNIHTKDYIIRDIDGAPKAQMSPQDAEELMDEFFQDFQDVMRQVDEGTVVLDTITQIYKLLSKVELDRVERAPKKYKQLYMKAYNEAAVRFQSMLKSHKKPDVNLIMIAQARDVYNERDSKIPGVEEAAVNRNFPYLASVIIHIYYDQDGYRFYAVEKCTYRDSLRGKVYDELDYDRLMQEIKGK